MLSFRHTKQTSKNVVDTSFENESHKFYSRNKEQRVMLPVVSRSDTHFGFAHFSFCMPDRTQNWNQTPVKPGPIKLNLSRSINLLSFPRKKLVFRKVAELAPEATTPIPFFAQNFFVNFHLISLPQKLYPNFSSKYLFLERRFTNLWHQYFFLK